MSEVAILEIAKQALYVALQVSWPLLLASLTIGTIIGVMMAATQIQEFTLTFVPKLLVMGIVLLVTGPYVLRTLVSFATAVFQKLPTVSY